MNGELILRETPFPRLAPNQILVCSSHSLISAGTELAKLRLAESNLLEKAQRRPDQFQKVLESVRVEGTLETLQKVRERLATPQALGYSLAGHVVEVGEGCDEFRVGMPVACGGATACHAETVSVPKNLAVRVPEGVPLRDACFTTVTSIGLHAVRTAGVTIGDRVLVIGLGLIGQLAVRLTMVAGAHVFGIDPRGDRAKLGFVSGAEQVDTNLDASAARQIMDWSGGRGADAVLITAGCDDNQPLVLAGAVARDRARIVVVGAIDLKVPREPFYEKELNLIISRSYGPGRYDPAFEEKGMEYPAGFVPWTERRNMGEILDQLASGRLSLEGIRGVTIPFGRAPEGYELLTGKAGSSPIAVVLEYEAPYQASQPEALPARSSLSLSAEPFIPTHSPRQLDVSFVGMGSFASSYLLPTARGVRGVALHRVVTTTPLKAQSVKARAGFRHAGTDAFEAIESRHTQVVFIATRHDSHARYVEAALLAHKAVFVEKPLALTPHELGRIATSMRATQGRLMVGFNRRFAPAVRVAIEALGSNRAGLRLLYRVNAGALPAQHWLLDPEIGGGRLLGECCHFIDLACVVANAPPSSIQAWAIGQMRVSGMPQDFRIEITFVNGASAGIEYLSGGDTSVPKERIEIHRSGLSAIIDDFRSVTYHRAGRRKVKKWRTRDKGHRAEVAAFLEAVRTGAPTPISEEESILSTALTFAAARSIREARPIGSEEFST
jgi:predicted dehydrogenase/threonine dehydrogenase-like Zn-dependent dehydrogenase